MAALPHYLNARVENRETYIQRLEAVVDDLVAVHCDTEMHEDIKALVHAANLQRAKTLRPFRKVGAL